MEHPKTMKRLILLLCLILCLTAVAAGRSDKGHRPWSDVDHWAEVFDDPSRDKWQKPLTVLTFIGVEHGATVADIGAGTGYFTRMLAAQVGRAGKVYAVDIEPKMLDYLMQREDVVAERVVPVVARRNDPKLPDSEIDVVVVMNTWHHVDKRPRYLRKLEDCLSPEGRVAIIDYRKGDLPVGPPDRRKLSREEVVSEFDEAGWRLVAESVALPYQYMLIFMPPEKPDTRAFIDR